MQKPLLFLITLLLIGGGFIFIRGSSTSPTHTATIDSRFEIGALAPSFETITFDGEPISLSQFEGKAVVIDFWAGWCAFCVEELPVLESLFREYGDRVVFLGVHRTDSGETIETGLEFATRQGVSYPLLQDQSGVLYDAASHGQSVMPVAVYLDSSHRVVDIKWGAKTESEMRENVLMLVEENG